MIAVQAARHLRAALPRVLAVVRPGQDELATALRAEGCEVVVCERAADGMGESLACAVRAAGAREGYVIALADMPFIRPSTIVAMLASKESLPQPSGTPSKRACGNLSAPTAATSFANGCSNHGRLVMAIAARD